MAKRSSKSSRDTRQATLFTVEAEVEQRDSPSPLGGSESASKSPLQAGTGNLQTELRNIVQQASAGTGKTFALSNRFLQLLVDGAKADSILASTFTRKGAGEILDRVLTRLGEAASSEAAAAKLGSQLNRKLDRAIARQLLRALVECLPTLQIGTLDGFFNRVARAFCFEIGLPPDWQVVDALRTRALRDQAIESILGDEQTAQLLRLMSKAEADRRVADLLAQTVDDLFEVYRDSTPQAWELFGNPRPVSDAEVTDLTERLTALSSLPSQISKQRDKLADLLDSGNWEDAAGLGLVKKVIAGESHFSRQEIPDSVRELVEESLSLIKRQLNLLVASRTKATHDLLERFDKVLQPLQLDSGELEFADVTFHLARTLQPQPGQMSERLGRRIDHLLLDEFQDTSPLQWAVLKPLAEHVTETNSGRTFFCVGDRKQAIYGWRGGVDRIFDAVEQGFADRIELAPPLLESYRSAQSVLELVNRVFGQMGTLAGKEPEPAAKKVFGEWQKKFQDHRAASPELQGYASVRIATRLEDEPDQDEVLLETIAEVTRLYHRYPGKEIAVLFRGNAPIAQVAVHLQRAGIATSEEAGNPLTDAAAVEVVLSALTLADHPDDGVARFHLAHSPLGPEFGFQPEVFDTQERNLAQAHRAAAIVREELLNRGYGQTVRRWARLLGDHCTEREAQRLEQLVEIAFAYDSSWTLRPHQFVEHVREQRVSDRTGARVRLMTMHASKGLGFDIVVAPLMKARSGWTSSPPEVVTGRSDPAGPIDSVCRYVRSDDRPLLPQKIQDVFADYQAQQINEELCLLYVTLTRAKQHLSVIIPAQAKSEWANVVGVLLRTLPSEPASEQGLIAEFGTADWAGERETQNPEAKAAESPVAGESTEPREPIALAKTQLGGRGAEWVVPSAGRRRTYPTPASSDGSTPERELGKATPRQAPIGGAREAAIAAGIAWHRLIQQVEWLEKPPHRDHLISSLADLVAEPTARADLADRFLTRIAGGEVTDWLTESEYRNRVLERYYSGGRTMLEPLRLDVRRELPFIVEIEGQWMEGQIDRLVLISEGDQIVAADLFDFKTGAVAAEELAAESQRYADQLLWYGRAVGQLFSLSLERVGLFLGFTTVRGSEGGVESRVISVGNQSMSSENQAE